jgi:hypothetical protein
MDFCSIRLLLKTILQSRSKNNVNPLLALYMCFVQATLLICQLAGIKDSRWKIQHCPTAGHGQPRALLNYASRSQENDLSSSQVMERKKRKTTKSLQQFQSFLVCFCMRQRKTYLHFITRNNVQLRPGFK